MELLSADPFDPEAQARIAERIRQAQVEENYQTAYEYMPESFSQVTMLYVDMEVKPTSASLLHEMQAGYPLFSQTGRGRPACIRREPEPIRCGQCFPVINSDESKSKNPRVRALGCTGSFRGNQDACRAAYGQRAEMVGRG